MSFKEWWNDDRTFEECLRDRKKAQDELFEEIVKALRLCKILDWLENKLSKINK